MLGERGCLWRLGRTYDGGAGVRFRVIDRPLGPYCKYPFSFNYLSTSFTSLSAYAALALIPSSACASF
jgi:hypothetical protein